MDIKEKISKPLYGVSKTPEFPDHYEMTKYFECHDPPSYMIKLLFTIFLERGLPRGEDKSDWIVSITYENKIWVLADRRRYTWSIYGEKDSEVEAARLKKRIINAAKVVNAELSQEASALIKSDEFVLENMGHKILRLYQMYRFEAEKSMERVKEFPEKSVKDLNHFVSNMNKMSSLKHDLEAHAISSIIYFFSYAESFFDVCFSLLDRKGLSHSQFSRLGWGEKFKQFFQPWTGEINDLYIALMRIREDHRNPMMHSESVRYINIGLMGYVPFDYNELSKPYSKRFHSIDVDEVEEVYKIFDTFIKVTEEHETCKFALAYLRSTLQIYFDMEAVKKIQKKMISLEVFEAELERRLDYQMAIENFDI